MSAAAAETIRIEVSPGEEVSALLIRPPQARACYVFAHGAGAGMTHASMETVAAGLAVRGIATLRYQFPYAPNTDPGVGTGPTYDPATFGTVTLPQIDITFARVPEPGGLVVAGLSLMGLMRRGRGKCSV